MDEPAGTELIRRPDANPFVFGAANLFGLGGLGYWLLGQRRKAMITWAIVMLGGVCTFGMFVAVAFVTAYDAYLLGQRLQNGEALRASDNGLPLLDLIFR